MANLQVKNVPETLHRRLRKHAARHGKTLSDFVLTAIKEQLERESFYERMAKRTPVKLPEPAWKLVEEARAEREAELEKRGP